MTIFIYKGLTRNSEIGDTPEINPISGDWDEVGIPNMAPMSVIKCYWMLQNARITAFTVSELLRENQQETPLTQIKFQDIYFFLEYISGRLVDKATSSWQVNINRLMQNLL